MHVPLSSRQEAILDLLLRYREGNGGLSPTVRELQALAGYRSPRSVTQILDALQKKGYIRRRPGARSLEVLREPILRNNRVEHTKVTIPIIGVVAAGAPVPSEEHIGGTITVAATLLPGSGDYFALRVQGDSMDLADIFDGDVIVVRRQESAQDNNYVVALVDGSSTVKRIRYIDRQIRLEPVSSNPIHHSFAPTDDSKIQGRVVAVYNGEPAVLRPL